MDPLIEKVVVAGTSHCVSKIIDVFLKPKLEEWGKKSENNKQFNESIYEKFSEYLNRAYEHNNNMDTIVFRNQQKKVDDLYIPLTLEKVDPVEFRSLEHIVIENYSLDLIPKYGKVLIVDTAGMGKSTIMKYLFIASIKETQGIPIFIELRNLKEGKSIIEFIMNELNSIDESFSEEYILRIIKGGGFIFFLDGYDEIEEEHKMEITKSLEEFISKSGESLCIMSSRDESDLNCFGNFQRFNIKPLDIDEAYDLIEKYDKNGEASNELITKLKKEQNLKILKEFLVNPLMVSLLYKAFEYKRIIPYKKHIFYRQVYDALFEDHDRTKGGAYVHPKKSKLDIEDFHSVLRCLGYLTLKKGKVSFNKEELALIIKDIKNIIPEIEIKASDFIDDIIKSVPLFVEEGINYRWAHKSFQEYFAACYICNDIKSKQQDILKGMSKPNHIARYYNVLDFCYDIDTKTFRRTIVYKLAKDFIDHCTSQYQSVEFKDLDYGKLNLRRNITFGRENYVIKDYKLKDIKIQSEEFSKYLKEISTEIVLGNLTSFLTMEELDDYLLCSTRGKYEVLIDLIYNKQLSLVRKFSYKGILDPKEMDELNELDEGIYSIDDNFNNITNNRKYFNSVSKMFIGISIESQLGVSTILDFEECLKLKESIEREIKAEQEESFF